MLGPLRFTACGSLGALCGPLFLSTFSDKDSLSDVLLFSSASLSSSEWMSTKCSSSSSSYKATKFVISRRVHVNVFRSLQRRSWKYFTRQIVKLTTAVSGFKYVDQQQHFGVDFTTQLNWNPINQSQLQAIILSTGRIVTSPINVRKKRVPITYDSSDWREFQANHKITNVRQR